jgi:hypothetical protein
MSLCANHKCLRPLGENVWPGGTCGPSCAVSIGAMAKSQRPDPDDEVASSQIMMRTRDLLDEWERAADFHRAMPAIVMYRAKGHTWDRIAKMVLMSKAQVQDLFSRFQSQR